MASTRLIKRRIRSSQNIAQITRAMQMVAASRMKRAQDQALSGKIYTEELQAVLASLLLSSRHLAHKFLRPSQTSQKAMLVVTTNKGLCGALNTNHFRLLNGWFKNQQLDKFQFVTVGKKGREFIFKMGGNIVADFSDLPDHFTFEKTLPISHFAIQLFNNDSVGETYISYTNFISTLSQRPKLVQLLPVTSTAINQSLGLLEDLSQTAKTSFYTKEYIIEPSAETIINWLLPYFLELEVYHFLLEAKASEHSARMVAMKNASDNASDLVTQLKLEYNKLRQQQITTEISDIVTAWKALQ